jgi:hydroxymethylglutaryl-CoA synthase
MPGIAAYGAYVPYYRLQRGAISAALGSGGGKGTRAVASFDEDATSMAVEAARLAMKAAGDLAPQALVFATASPPYVDKTNATAIHAALGMPTATAAFDLIGSTRSAVAAHRMAATSPIPMLAVMSDVRTGLPGGADERDGGDAAVAFLYSGTMFDGRALVEIVGRGAATNEFLDRWRIPGEDASHVWEERFGEHAYVPLAEIAINDALKSAGVSPGELDHVIVTGLHSRAVKRVAGSIGARPEAIVDDLTSVIGNTGTAHFGLLLADVLDRAEAGQVILAVNLSDGADAVVLRTTDELVAYRSRRASTVAEQIAAGRDDLGYQTYLTWRGFLQREPPRRPDPERPAAPPSLRTEPWKYGFVGSKCTSCGTRHLPPARVCVRCSAVDQMEPERLADVPATIATYTIDRLAFSLSPPVVVGVIDFDGGGRFQCELTDVDPAAVKIGDRVEMSFRRLFTAGGVHNYFWKAKPIARGDTAGGN